MKPHENYEEFIHAVCQSLSESREIIVHRKKVYTGARSGRKITTDVSFDTHLLGARIVGIVECKFYKERVEVSDVEEFHSKIDDIGAHKGIMFTTIGYEAGAEKVAKGRGIALFVLKDHQHPEDVQIITRSAPQLEASDFLRGKFFPWGRFSDLGRGLWVSSVEELFYALAMSDVGRWTVLAGEQMAQATREIRS